MRTVRSANNVKKCVFPIVLLIAALSPRIAAAALGEPETSVQTEVARLHGSITVSQHASYRLHELQLTSGTVVREFAGSDGKVFAVAWSGPTVPNLQIRQSDLVVQAGGHMRSFSGVAYLPLAVPGGVSVGDLH